MSWRLAQSLLTLRDEANLAAPDRSKVSDGTIGNAAHARTASDHNPNAAGVVCALDLTHDPDWGADMNAWSETIRANPHPDVKYVIWDHNMFSAYPAHGIAPFTWRPYTGSNTHSTHMHVSVGVGRDGRSVQPYDDTNPWGIATQVQVPPPPSPPPAPPSAPAPVPGGSDVQTPYLRQGSTGPQVVAMQAMLNFKESDRASLAVDGDFGPVTDAKVRSFQSYYQLGTDGIVGPITWQALVDV